MRLKPVYLLLILIAIFFGAGFTFGQNSAAPDANRDVKFQISSADGKAVYRIGDPVKLILSYASPQPGFVVETYYSPLFDDVVLEPTGEIYPWLYRLNRHYSYDDVSAPQKLSQSPIHLEITLNDLVRFDKPGKYKVKILSKRVWKSTGEFSFRSRPIPLSSNEIEFEMREMTQAEEQAEVDRISALLDSAKTLPRHEVVKRELDYLTGDVSTVEKVR